jgi:hypothetical protein
VYIIRRLWKIPVGKSISRVLIISYKGVHWIYLARDTNHGLTLQHDNELSGCIKDVELLVQWSNHQFFEKVLHLEASYLQS